MQNVLFSDEQLTSSFSHVGRDVESVKNNDNIVNIQKNTDNEDNFVREKAKRMQKAGRNKQKKRAILIELKTAIPDVDLMKFISQYVEVGTKSNFESIENYEIAEEVENHFSVKKLGKKLKKGVKKGLKLAGKLAPIVKSIPVVGGLAATVLDGAGKLGSLSNKIVPAKIKEAAKAAGYTNTQIQQIIKNPEQSPKVYQQALNPANAVQTTLAPLAPMAPTMVSLLKAKGVTTSDKTSLEDLATLFHRRIVQGKNSLEEVSWYEHDPMYFEQFHYFEKNYVEFSEAGKILDDIVNFFKKAKENPATEAEKQAAESVIKQDAKLTAEKKEDLVKDLAEVENKSGIGNQKLLLYTVFALFAFIILKKVE